MADVIRERSNAEFAFQNPGGVRLNGLKAGKITAKDIYQMDPFDNVIQKYKVRGQEIIDMFQKAYNETGDFPIICSGCNIMLNVNEYEEIESIKILLENGKPINPNGKYSIALNSYMASVYGFAGKYTSKDFPRSNQITFDYLQKHQHINYSNVSRVKYCSQGESTP